MNRPSPNFVQVLRAKVCSVMALLVRKYGLVCFAVSFGILPLSAAEPVSKPEIRDVILMLENGPLHFQVQVVVGGMSPEDARRATINRLLKTLDTNGDGTLSRAEAARSPLFREKQRPKAAEFLKEIGASTTMSRQPIWVR